LELQANLKRFAVCCTIVPLAWACRKSEPAVAPAIARVVESPDDLLWGPAATGAIGDFMMENGEITAVITRDDSSSGFACSAGNLADLAPLPDGEDHINEMFLYLNDEFPRQARYGEVKIHRKGGRRRPAIVRAIGVDTGNPDIEIETDYVLRPGEHWLTVETRFTNTGTSTIESFSIGDAVQWGRTEHMAPGFGFDLPGRRVRVDWICGIGNDTSYAIVPDGQTQFDTPSGSMWSDPMGAVVDLVPKKTVTYVRHVVVGRGDTASLAPAVAKLRGDHTGRVTGRVTHDGEAVRDAMVRIFDDKSRLAGLARVDRNGWYSIDLAPGRYWARADAPGRVSVQTSSSALLSLRDDAIETKNFGMGAQGVLAWRIQSDDGRAPPVRLTVVGVEGTSTPHFGPSFRADGAENLLLSARGIGEHPISPGEYRVVVSRGPEYEVLDRRVSIRAGVRTEISGNMARSVDTPGFISADLHQHAAPSFDSGVSLPDRALSNAVEGVEVLVATEHNVLVDYRSVVATSGLGRDVYPVVGVEATTHSVGHFNALPLQLQPDKPGGGMVDPEGWMPAEIFAFLEKLALPDIDPFLQVNHPRSSKTGYFDLMKLDDGRSRDPRFSGAFDGIEVVTFGRRNETDPALRDWFALLRRGERYTATGTSDSHAISHRPVGWPRTYVCVDNDSPPRLDLAEFTAALKRGCATVSAGPFVTIRSGEHRMGDLARAEGGGLDVEVEVRAATWIGTDRLVLHVDGEPAIEVPLAGKEVMRYRGTHRITCESDCFVVALVDSEERLDPVIGVRPDIDPLPIALTNPIFLDVDGDGRWSPAGAKEGRP
jgi:hypothetical protein